MGTSTPELQLYRPDRFDFVSVLTDLNANMDKLDAFATDIKAGPDIFPANGSGDLTMATGAPVDIAGASVSFTLLANAQVTVSVVYDARLTVIGTGYFYGEYAVNGVTSGRKAIHTFPAAETRTFSALNEKLNLTPGPYIIKLQGHKDNAGGTAQLMGGSHLLVTVYR
jgi:hypothetical protein